MLDFQQRPGARLMRRELPVGPYRFVRHPMYLALLAAAPGALLIFWTWPAALFLPLSWTLVRRANLEEGLLAAEFGAAWEAYTSRVPKWLPRRAAPSEKGGGWPVK